MRGRDLRQALRAGRRVYGIAVEGYGQPRWPRFFSGRGLDFVFMDNEHTPLNRETMAWAAQAYAAYGIAPLLRIPELSASLAAIGVDLGAHGIIAPYVETVDQVKALAGAVKYRPLKGAALRQALDSGAFPNDETRAYLESYNPDAVLVIMIESQAGIDALPDLLAVPGVDAVLIGPHDLSISLGIAEQYDHPRFIDALRAIIEVCTSRNTGVGIHYVSGTNERALEWIRLGFNLIIHRSDTLYVAQGIETELGWLRQQLDGDADPADEHLGASGHRY
ncbi:MAG: aldolase/citrate lyase family protein [Chloroflexota bacterium]|nr:MAG: aldolase [Chloroflexota bacterium]